MKVNPPNAPLWLIGLLAGVALLYFGRSVFIPLVLAVLITYTLAPAVSWLQRHHLPRFAGTTLVMVLLAGGILAGGSVLTQQAVALVEEVPKAARHVREQVQASRRRGGTVDKIERATAEIERSSQELAGSREPAAAPPPADNSLRSQAGAFLWWGSTGLMALAGHAVVIFFLVFFMLLSGDLFRRKLLKISGTAGERKVTLELLDEIDTDIKRYLLVRLLTTVIVGVATWAALALAGLEHALIWGLIAGVCNVIPYIGPIIVSGGLFLVGFLQFGSITKAAIVSAIALLISALEGWLLDPPLMGKVERMNTVAVLVGLMFWTAVWGGWGALLAVPMLAISKAICDRLDPLKPVGVLLGE